MGTAAYNLVIVRGTSEDLKEFETKAHKTESEAFCMEQLVPIPDYLTSKDYMSPEELAFRYLVYGAKWVGAFGVLIEKNETSLKYFVNSKYTKAELHFLSIIFEKLSFTQAFVELTEENCGVIEHEYGKCISTIEINDITMDWCIASDINTYLFIEELLLKIQYLKQSNPIVFDEITEPWSTIKHSFFSLVNKTDFIKEHQSFYESLYETELELEKRDLDYARNGMAYPFQTNYPEHQKIFIEENFLDSEKKTIYLNSIKIKIDNYEKDAECLKHNFIWNEDATDELPF